MYSRWRGWDIPSPLVVLLSHKLQMVEVTLDVGKTSRVKLDIRMVRGRCIWDLISSRSSHAFCGLLMPRSHSCESKATINMYRSPEYIRIVVSKSLCGRLCQWLRLMR